MKFSLQSKLISFRIKVLTGFTLLFLVISAGSFTWFRFYITQRTTGRIRAELSETATGAAAWINGDEWLDLYHHHRHRSLSASTSDIHPVDRNPIETDPRYQQQLEWFATIQQLEPRAHPYIVIVSLSEQARDINQPFQISRTRSGMAQEQWGEIVYIASQTSTDLSSHDLSSHDLSSHDLSSHDPRQSLVPPTPAAAVMAWRYQRVVIEPYPLTDGNSQWFRAYVPLSQSQDHEIAVLGIDFAANDLTQIQRAFFYQIPLLMGSTYGIVFLLVYGIAGILTRRMAAFTQTITQMMNGQPTESLSTFDHSPCADEVQVLAAAFDLMATQLQEAKANYRWLVENMNDTLFNLNAEGQLVYISPSVERMLGYQPGEIMGRHYFQLVHPDDHALLRQQLRGLRATKPLVHELRIVDRSGHSVDVRISSRPLVENRQIVGAIGIVTNISAEKQLAQSLQAALQQNHIFFKEVHHRVKNNLQIVSSLLRLQADSLEDPCSQTLLRESQQRVQSIALVHEHLYRSDVLGQVNLGRYLHALITNILVSFGVDSHRIQSQIELDEICLRADKAVLCGLILNELVMNSLKYAFPDQCLGKLWVRCFQQAEEVQLIVGDDGVGMADRPEVSSSDGLGLSLVHDLVEQLEGMMKISREQGTTFEIHFSC